jgi:hypothetical protein
VNAKVQAKIPLAKKNVTADMVKDIKVGDKIKVLITYLSPVKIIVEVIL